MYVFIYFFILVSNVLLPLPLFHFGLTAGFFHLKFLLKIDSLAFAVMRIEQFVIHSHSAEWFGRYTPQDDHF